MQIPSIIIMGQTQSPSMTPSAQESMTQVVVPRITRDQDSVPGEDRIFPVFSRIVTRTKAGIRPRESFTKDASPTRTNSSPTRPQAEGEDSFTKYASPTRGNDDGEDSFTSPTRTLGD